MRSFKVFAYVLFIPHPAYLPRPGPYLDRILVLCHLRAQGIQKDPLGNASHLNNARQSLRAL